MKKREYARRVRFEACASGQDEDFEDGASLTVRRRASRLTIDSEESIEYFGTARSRRAPRAMPFSDNCSSS